MVYNLVDSATLLVDKKFHTKNIKITEKILQVNRYPENFIKKYTKKRLNFNKLRNRGKILKRNALLFNSVTRTLRKHNFLIVPYNNNNLSCIIKKGKDDIKKTNGTNVVYKIDCMICDVSYIGETKRRICKRMEGHLKDIKNKLNKPIPNNCKLLHSMDFNNVQGRIQRGGGRGDRPL